MFEAVYGLDWTTGKSFLPMTALQALQTAWREFSKSQHKDAYAMKKRLGLCIHHTCVELAEPEKTRCPKHAEKNRIHKKRSMERKNGNLSKQSSNLLPVSEAGESETKGRI